MSRVTTLAALLVLVVASATRGAEPANKVLFIGIDGCRFDAIQAAKTTHLARLVAEGAYANNTLILGPRETKSDTISGPGWSSLLTGVWADKHGVLDNEFKNHALNDYPDFFVRLKSQQPKARTISIIDWAPIHLHIVTGATIAKTSLRPHVTPQGKVEQDYEAGDALTAETSVDLLTSDDPTAMFVYFGQVDETGHKHGFHPSVEPYIKAIQTVDGYIGQLLKAVHDRKTYQDENWLILISSDHGGKGTGHGGGHREPEIFNSFLILHGQSVQPGKIAAQTYLVDVPVTALTHLGVMIDPAWKLDGKPVGLR
jgi:predicted AlkP superfamily pyrophosphatase or phosphodiesterase